MESKLYLWLDNLPNFNLDDPMGIAILFLIGIAGFLLLCVVMGFLEGNKK